MFGVGRFFHIFVSAFQPTHLNLCVVNCRIASDRHFTGNLHPERDNAKVRIEFEFTAAPPDLRLSVYFMVGYRSRTLYSHRFDFKARSRDADLESRRDWATVGKCRFVGDVFAFPPLEIRGVELRSRFDVQLESLF